MGVRDQWAWSGKKVAKHRREVCSDRATLEGISTLTKQNGKILTTSSSCILWCVPESSDASLPSCTFDVTSGLGAIIAFLFIFVIVAWNWLNPKKISSRAQLFYTSLFSLYSQIFERWRQKGGVQSRNAARNLRDLRLSAEKFGVRGFRNTPLSPDEPHLIVFPLIHDIYCSPTLGIVVHFPLRIKNGSTLRALF